MNSLFTDILMNLYSCPPESQISPNTKESTEFDPTIFHNEKKSNLVETKINDKSIIVFENHEKNRSSDRIINFTLTDLPNDLFPILIPEMSLKQLGILACVDKKLNKIFEDNQIWKIVANNFEFPFKDFQEISIKQQIKNSFSYFKYGEIDLLKGYIKIKKIDDSWEVFKKLGTYECDSLVRKINAEKNNIVMWMFKEDKSLFEKYIPEGFYLSHKTNYTEKFIYRNENGEIKFTFDRFAEQSIASISKLKEIKIIYPKNITPELGYNSYVIKHWCPWL